MDKLEIVLVISYLEQLFWDFGIVEKKIYFFERKAINLPKLYKTLVPHFLNEAHLIAEYKSQYKYFYLFKNIYDYLFI